MAKLGEWFQIEPTNRQTSEVRRNVDQLTANFALLQTIQDKMSQMSNGGANPENVEQAYGLAAGEGSEFESLIASTANELENSPFFQQYLSRVG